MVCCRAGHKSWECPELRCFICYSKGHAAKQCPNAGLRCDSCRKTGHSADRCPWQLLFDAAKWQNWKHVRCANCNELGHPMCANDEEWTSAGKPEPRVKVAQAAHVRAALTGKRTS